MPPRSVSATAGWWPLDFFADLTVFDAQKVIDRATYTEPFQYSEGVEYVIVNGQLVLDNGRHTGARPGRALRRAG